MDEAPKSIRPLTADERVRLDALVHHVAPRLYAYVRRFHGPGSDVDEIVAESFCRAALNCDAVFRSDRPELYVFTIARNLCRDRIRRRSIDYGADERLAELADAADGPGDELTTREQRRALGAAVADLPHEQREIVVLRLSGELRFEDIASLLGIPLGTALSRMHAAVQNLREQMGVQHERSRPQPQRV